MNEATTASKEADQLSKKELEVVVRELNEQIEHIHTVFELIAIY